MIQKSVIKYKLKITSYEIAEKAPRSERFF